jgi:hypothetical protein
LPLDTIPNIEGTNVLARDRNDNPGCTGNEAVEWRVHLFRGTKGGTNVPARDRNDKEGSEKRAANRKEEHEGAGHALNIKHLFYYVKVFDRFWIKIRLEKPSGRVYDRAVGAERKTGIAGQMAIWIKWLGKWNNSA